MNYRVTFHDGPNGNRRMNVDVSASSFEEAEKIAYGMHGGYRALRDRGYTNATISEVQDGPKLIGLEIEYTDTCLKKNFRDYMFIKANTEAEAVEYYNRNFKGTRFWFNANKVEEDGKCIRGRVLDTYYAC